MPLPALRLASKTSTTTLANSTAQTTLCSLVLPAGALAISAAVANLRVWGDLLNNTSSTGTLTLRLKLVDANSTNTLTTHTLAYSTYGATRQAWRFDASVLVTASTRQRTSSVSVFGAVPNPQVAPSTQTGSNATTLVLTGQFSAASTLRNADCLGGYVELLR